MGSFEYQLAIGSTNIDCVVHPDRHNFSKYFDNPDGTEWNQGVLSHGYKSLRKGVVIAPFFADQRVLLQLQYRRHAKSLMLQFPMGATDSDDASNEDAARRELFEESNLIATEYASLGMMSNVEAFVAHGCLGDIARNDNTEKIAAHIIFRNIRDALLVAEGVRDCTLNQPWGTSESTIPIMNRIMSPSDGRHGVL